TGVDRGAACLGEFEVAAGRALDVPAFAGSELDQGAQPLVASGQFMCARHGASWLQEGVADGRTPWQIGAATAGTIRRRDRAWCRARRGRLCPVAGGTRSDAPAGRASRRADRLRWPARRWP